ncbi:MAG: LAO/AO transport system kinase [Sphingobacteriales bacterium]|jgi:LAO/AO transport system kinase
MSKINNFIDKLKQGDQRSLARAISLVENESLNYKDILENLNIDHNVQVIGVTGPPGAGKSTLVNALVTALANEGNRVGVVAVDPTSPFNFGSLLGDRIRMSSLFLNENVFIRSLATRGSLGGLSVKAIEIVDVMKSANFDYIIVETVGVGQSEVEIAGLADTSVVVMVPEAGDDVQVIKSGIMEIAHIFLVNKADRDGAEIFCSNLRKLIHDRPKGDWNIPVLKAVATKNEGIDELIEAIKSHKSEPHGQHRTLLLAEKAYHLIREKRMHDISKRELTEKIQEAIKAEGFNLYKWLNNY